MEQNATVNPVEGQAVGPAVVDKKRGKKRKKDPSLPKGPRYVLGSSIFNTLIDLVVDHFHSPLFYSKK
jgi:hypothetical protein